MRALGLLRAVLEERKAERLSPLFALKQATTDSGIPGSDESNCVDQGVVETFIEQLDHQSN